MKYYILYNGGKIYYSDTGTGETIILLHGYLETSEIWTGFIQKFAGKFRIISVDLPGHGSSKVYGESHSMEFMAGALKGLIDNLDIKKIFLIGHSLGGYVTLAFAELYPEMLMGYCLFHSHPFADTIQIRQKRENEIKVVKAGKKYLIYPEHVSMMYSSDNIDKFSASLKRSKDIASTICDEGIIAVLNGMMIRAARLSVMENSKVPFLWILGRKDNFISCEAMLEKVKLPPNAKALILENSGHMGFVEEEDLSVNAIDDFINNL